MPATYSFAPSSPSCPPQCGAGMIEFAIVALPILFLGLGSVELSHWFYTRQALSVALLDAGRAAITHHNRSTQIISVFEHALRPVYAAPTSGATTQRLQRALSERQARLNTAPWKIEVLSPSASVYSDFSDSGLHIDGAQGRATINNHYLAEQDLRYRAQGWASGRGPVSGQTIYEANTAVLRLSWLHEPRLPLLAPLLKALGNPLGNTRQRALAAGYLPMTRQITLLMQSHPVNWADDPSGKVIYHNENNPSSTCSGWLCGDQSHLPNESSSWPFVPPDTVPDPVSGLSPEPHDMLPATGTPGPADGNTGTAGDPEPDWSGLTPAPDDPACGVTICCF